jgi:probable rRNA maturation factor
VDVVIHNEQTALPLSEEKVVSVALEFKNLYHLPHEEVIIHFVSKETITQLHDEFFDDNTPTDCISFPIDDSESPGHRILGEIFVCPEVAIEYAQNEGVDPLDETLLYTIHALLHLIGYNDIEEEEREEMRLEESFVLNHLKQKKLSF